MCEWSRGGTGSPRFPQMFTDVVDFCSCARQKRRGETTGLESIIHQTKTQRCYRKIPTSG